MQSRLYTVRWRGHDLRPHETAIVATSPADAKQKCMVRMPASFVDDAWPARDVTPTDNRR